MRIPKKLKIGGMVYTVEITDNLNSGSNNSSAEISYRDLIIRVCPMARARMESSFLHEVIHGMADAMGFVEHDEKLVDALSQMLYQVIQDNPEMFLPDEDEGAADEQRDDQK